MGNIMNDEYKDFACYKSMRRAEQQRFDKIVKHYAGFLGGGRTTNATGLRLTLHDFEHHCYDLYKYVSEVLLSDAAYLRKTGLGKRELYILNLAILFHDISLHLVNGCRRESHAEESAKWVLDEYSDTRSTFADVCDMTPEEVRALCVIIEAHSDGEKGQGIFNPELTDYTAKSGKIRTRILAGILRLVDELDVSELRIGDRRFEAQLEKQAHEYEQAKFQYNTTPDDSMRPSLEQEMERLEPYAQSYTHWKRLHYFLDVERNNTCIVLKGNVHKIEEDINSGNEEEAEDIIKTVFCKVSREFLQIQKVLFDTTEGVRNIIAVDRIEVSGIETSLKSRLDREYQQIKRSIEDNEQNKTECCANKLQNSERLEREITRLIETNKLLSPGHFIMNSRYCVDDWIDTRAILEDRDIYNKCVRIFIEHMKINKYDNAFLIGLDLQGSLLASTIGIILGIPFTYIIPVHKIDQNSEHDMGQEFSQEKNIVLFTDAVTTGHSIDEACASYKISAESIRAIYTILYRPVKNDKEKDDMSEKYMRKVYYVNDSYSVRLLDRNKCDRNREDKCLACNRQIALGGNQE